MSVDSTSLKTVFITTTAAAIVSSLVNYRKHELAVNDLQQQLQQANQNLKDALSKTGTASNTCENEACKQAVRVAQEKTQELSRLVVELEKAKGSLQEYRKTILELEKKPGNQGAVSDAKLKAALDATTKKLAAAEITIQQLQHQLQESNAILHQVKTNGDKYENETAERIKGLTAAAMQAEQKAAGADKQVQQLKAQASQANQLQAQLHDAKAKIEELEAKLRTAEDKGRHADQQVQLLQKELASGTRATGGGEQGGNRQVEDRLLKSENEVFALRGRIQVLENEETQLRKQLHAALERENIWDNTHKSLQHQLQQKSAEVHTLTRRLASTRSSLVSPKSSPAKTESTPSPSHNGHAASSPSNGHASTSTQQASRSSSNSPKRNGGIGLELLDEEEGIVVKAVLHGSSAERSGRIHPGDRLMAIDKRSIRGFRVNDISHAIVGEAGSFVTLTLYRKGIPFEVVLERLARK